MYIRISLIADFELTADEVWPDGDAPEKPTAADVLALLTGGDSDRISRRTLDEWNLLHDVRVIVNTWDDRARTHAEGLTR